MKIRETLSRFILIHMSIGRHFPVHLSVRAKEGKVHFV